jgi:hypothetical protein
MASSDSEPTPAMIAFYERRTREHIERVGKCLLAIEQVTVYGGQLTARAKVHDASKFDSVERIPYIWLTELYRSKRDNESFSYPVGMEQRVRRAIAHHMSANRHHPEFHADPNHMTEVDLIEMICDWTAMAQEFKQSGGSARGWADKTVGKRVQFNIEKTGFIYDSIQLLDRQLGVIQK